MKYDLLTGGGKFEKEKIEQYAELLNEEEVLHDKMQKLKSIMNSNSELINHLWRPFSIGKFKQYIPIHKLETSHIENILKGIYSGKIECGSDFIVQNLEEELENRKDKSDTFLLSDIDF